MPMPAEQHSLALEPTERLTLIAQALNSTMFQNFEFSGLRAHLSYIYPGEHAHHRGLHLTDIETGDTSYFRIDQQGNIVENRATRCVHESIGEGLSYYRHVPIDAAPEILCDKVLRTLSAENKVPASAPPMPIKAAA